MADLSAITDDQLQQLHLQSMPDEELRAIYGQPPTITEQATDAAKQAGVGLVEGVANLPTAVPRIFNAVGPAVGSAMEKVVGAISPAKAAEMHAAEAEREKFVAEHPAPDIATSLNLPQPETTAGQYARTAGEFVPATMAGPGNLARNAVSGATAGLTSEAAGQATKGTPLEPYARVAAGAVGGLATAKPNAAELTPQKAIEAGSKAYELPAVKNILISPDRFQSISDSIIGQLDKARLNDRLVPTTREIVSQLATPIGGALHSVEDYQTARTLLGHVAGNYNNPLEQKAASMAIESLDKQFGAIPQSDLVSGDIGAARQALEQGRADYAAGKAAERVQQKIDNAELQAASAHSGGNIDNATRQKLRPMLTSAKQGRGLTPEDFDQIDQVVRGSTAGNALRATGSILGGRGGLGTLLSAAEGFRALGPIGVAAPVAGYGIKKLGDALTVNAANKAVQQILSRAPSGQGAVGPIVPSPLAAALAGARAGALGSNQQDQRPLLQ